MNLKRIASLLENKGDLTINEVVLSQAQKKGQVLYGARAYNKQSPTYLKKKTYDYDILTKSPKKAAKATAEILRRRLRKEVTVSKGQHKGTYRIHLNGEQIIDYTQLKSKPKTKKVWGIEVRDIKSIKRNAVRLSRKKGTKYRREKDLDTLSRIKKIEDMEKKFRF